MNLHLTDRDKQTLMIALEELRKTKAGAIGKPHVPLNEYDILADAHVLMYAINLMVKLSGKPVTTFANAQQPTEKGKPLPDENKQPDEPAGPNYKWKHHPKMGWVRVPDADTDPETPDKPLQPGAPSPAPEAGNAPSPVIAPQPQGEKGDAAPVATLQPEQPTTDDPPNQTVAPEHNATPVPESGGPPAHGSNVEPKKDKKK